MLKFGLKFLHDKRKDGKHLSQEVIPELPAFEWQVTEETGFESCLPPPLLTPPEDALFGNADRRRKTFKRHSRSSTNVESGRIRLMQIIEEENSRTRFRDYLVSRYCEENLDFYMDIVKFHSHFEIENSKIGEIISAANHIWNEYLDPETSSKLLNVPQELSNNCKRRISKNLFTVDLFDKLQQHCFELMLQDSLPKFTRNSVFLPSALSLPEQQNCSPTPNYLCPPSFDTPPPRTPPRKSTSSGSLRAKIIASLKNVTESTSQSPINTAPSSPTSPTSPTFPTFPSTSPPVAPIPPQDSLQSSASSLTSTTTTSTSTEPSTPTTPTTSISTPSTPDNSNRDSTTSTASTTSTISASVPNGQSRTSVASAISIANITKRILSVRRNSTSSNSSQFSVSSLSSVLYLSSMEKFRNMPGSYPCPLAANNNNNKKEEEDIDELPSTWQRLRRNISTPNFQNRTPNFQARPVSIRSRSSSTLANNVQTYNPDKNLPPLPS